MRVVNPGQPYAEGAARFIGRALGEFGQSRRINLGLAGGNTPKPIYEALRGAPLPWDTVDLWLSDERWVPPDHPESNGLMAAETLSGHVPATLHRPLWSENLTATESAAFYEATLRGLLTDRQPDVVLLGLGTDGHIASLFPGTAALSDESARLLVANEVPQLGTWRITSTFRLLGLARRVIVLVAGVAKADILARVVEGREDQLPASTLIDLNRAVTFLVDHPASQGLTATDVEQV